MKRFLSFLLVFLMISGVLSGCQSEKNPENPTTAPSASEGTTQPQSALPTEPEPTAPPTEITPQGAIINDLICTVTYGDGTQEVVENPMVSSVYNYILAERASSQEKMPSEDLTDYMDTMVTLHFQVNEKSALLIYIWSNNYAAIATNASNPDSACRYHKFSDNAHASILLTLKNN